MHKHCFVVTARTHLRTLFSLMSGQARLTNLSSGPSWTLFPLWSLQPRKALGTLWTFGSCRPLWTLDPLYSGNSRIAHISKSSLEEGER